MQTIDSKRLNIETEEITYILMHPVFSLNNSTLKSPKRYGTPIKLIGFHISQGDFWKVVQRLYIKHSNICSGDDE